MAGLIAQPDVSQPGRLRQGHTVGVVSVLTVVVAVCGYLREAALAARFGVSATMDAYFSAIFIPTIVYMVLIAGTLSPVFIPILLQRDINEDRTELSETFSIVTNFVVLLLAAIVCCSMITARMWLQLLFPGFNAETVGITLRLIYIIFPSVLFVAMAGLLTAVLNGFRKFALAAIAPALSSITVVVAVTISRGPQDIYMVGIATAIGFLLQLLVLIPAIVALGIRYRLVFNFRHSTICKLLRLGGPLLLYLVVANASLLLERNLASRLSAGAVSTVTYVMRLFTVPSNFLAAPLAVVAYPLFAREALREKWGDLGRKVSRIFRLVLFIFMPVTLWTVLNALPLTRILYERGAFRYADSVLTARIFSLYGIGILPNALAVALLPCFYAMQDTISPLWAEAVNFLFYLFAAIFLVNHFGLLGLAISRVVQFYLFAAMLIFVLFRRRLVEIDSTLRQFVSRVGLASLTMGLVSWIVLHLVRGAFDAGILPVRLGIVFVMGLASGAVYLSVTRLLKLSEAAQVLNAAIDLLPWPRFIPVQ